MNVQAERLVTGSGLLAYSTLGGVVSVTVGLAAGRLVAESAIIQNVVAVPAIALPTAAFGLLGRRAANYLRDRHLRPDLDC